MRDKIKSAWAFYQKMMFFFTVGWNELMKPLTPFKDAAIFTIILKYLGILNPTIHLLIMVYSIGTLFVIIFGIIMVKNGVVKFNNFLSNQENEMLLKIDEINEKLK